MLIPIIPTTSFSVQAVTFDGSADYLTRGADFTSNADSKLLTFSFWIKYSSTPAGYLYSDNSGDTRILFSGGNLVIEGKSSATLRLQAQLSAPSTGSWHHICGSFDMANTGNRQILVDGSAASVTYSTYTDNVIDFTKSDHLIGATTAGGPVSDYLAADLAEVYIAMGQYATSTQLATFRTADGKPANIGTDGSRITGTAPTLYLSCRRGDAASDFATNRGSGGGMTENGALALASTSPSD